MRGEKKIEKTSQVKHKPVRNCHSGRPNKGGVSKTWYFLALFVNIFSHPTRPINPILLKKSYIVLYFD